MESGSEEIGSLMQRISSNLLQQGIGRLSNKEEETATEFPADDKDRPGDFDNLIEVFGKQN